MSTAPDMRCHVPETPVSEEARQREVDAFLASGRAHGATESADAGAVQSIETHGAIVFLCGDDVYKIKKAVRFSYMDFSTLELRRSACAQELAINAPHAPGLYLGLVAITRGADGGLELDGTGEPVEWAVHMRCFPGDCLMSAVAERGPIERGLATRLADAVFAYHADAAKVIFEGAADRLRAVIADVTRGLSDEALPFDTSDVGSFARLCAAHLDRVGPLLDRRAGAGLVRRCHGDLHLANIVLWQERPTLFDAIEFDDRLATIDTLYDLAFLLMDLDVRGQRAAANVVLNRYLWRSQTIDDLDGLAALPLFMALRAAIRAMVLAQRAAQAPSSKGSDTTHSALALLRAALGYLVRTACRLVAIGGLSGTGKSTLAASVAPMMGAAPGALCLRSDLERKAMLGAGETDRLPPEAYTPQANLAVYERLQKRARAALAAGHSVVVDAVLQNADERCAIEHVARDLSVPFDGLWLEAPAATLFERVEHRVGDASDATADVVRRQLARDGAPVGWSVIDASQPRQTVSSKACDILRIPRAGPALPAGLPGELPE